MADGSAKAGKDFLIKMGDGAGPEVFTTIGGLRGGTIKFSAEEIDVTHVGSSQWKTLLSGAGIKSFTISGNGVFTNDTVEQLLRTKALAQALNNFQLIDEDGNKYQGAFKIKELEYAGTYKDEVKYTFSLQSSGAIAYTESA